jgi:ABC-type phosphate transport system permease subunit
MSNHITAAAFFMIVAAIVGATIAADLGTYLNEFVPKGRSYASIGFLGGIAVIGIIAAL